MADEQARSTWPGFQIARDIRGWLVPAGDIHLKVVTPEGDPVEMSRQDLGLFIDELTRLAGLYDEYDKS